MAENDPNDLHLTVRGELEPTAKNPAAGSFTYTVHSTASRQVRDIDFTSAFPDGKPRYGSVHIDCPNTDASQGTSLIVSESRGVGGFSVKKSKDTDLSHALGVEQRRLTKLGVGAPETADPKQAVSCSLTPAQLQALKNIAER